MPYLFVCFDDKLFSVAFDIFREGCRVVAFANWWQTTKHPDIAQMTASCSFNCKLSCQSCIGQHSLIPVFVWKGFLVIVWLDTIGIGGYYLRMVFMTSSYSEITENFFNFSPILIGQNSTKILTDIHLQYFTPPSPSALSKMTFTDAPSLCSCSDITLVGIDNHFVKGRVCQGTSRPDLEKKACGW